MPWLRRWPGAAVNSTLRQVGGAIAVAVLGSVLADAYTGKLRPELVRLAADQASTALGSITEASQLAQHMPDGAWLQAAAGRAYLHGMSALMLICAGLAALAVLTSLKFLPGRSTKTAALPVEQEKTSTEAR